MKVYLDNATTTRVDDRVLEEMRRFYVQDYGAPTTEYGHSWGVRSLEALVASRQAIASPLKADPDNVILTSGGVESNNMAVLGRALAEKRGNVITSKIEHSSILGSIAVLEKRGFSAKYLDVDREGLIDPANLDSAIDDETILVTIGHGNGEIGTVQPVEEMANVCAAREVSLHLDSRVSFLWEKLDLSEVEADLVSLTGHTIHGPKGIGALIKAKECKIEPIMHGPGTEFNQRPGTVNLPGAVGMAKAVKIWDESEVEDVRRRRDMLWRRIKEEIPDTELNGPEVGGLANILSCNFQYIEGESVLLYLDMANIAVSTGSACSSKNLKPSYVLSAIGIPPERSHGSIRFSLSRYNSDEQMAYATEKIVEVVGRLKKMSSMR